MPKSRCQARRGLISRATGVVAERHAMCEP